MAFKASICSIFVQNIGFQLKKGTSRLLFHVIGIDFFIDYIGTLF